MDTYSIVKQMLKDSGKMMSELVKGMGVTLQSLNRSLHGNITLERFKRIVELTGGELYVGRRGEDGKMHIKTLDKLKEEWEK